MNSQMFKQHSFWVIVALLFTLALNYLAEALPIGGQTTGQISDRFKVLLTPADYTFSIWGVIYAGLIGFAIYQALPAGQNNPHLNRIRPWFMASSLFNGAWIVAWHSQNIGLSVLLMLGLLCCLLVTYLSIRAISNTEFWTLRLPFSLYLAWVSVATIVNIAVWLNLGWQSGLPEGIWAVLLIAVAALLGLAALRLRRDWVFAIALAWALIGIAIGQWPMVGVSLSAGVAAVVLLVEAYRKLLLPRLQPLSVARLHL